MEGPDSWFVCLLNVNEDLKKALLTYGCYFDRHTPTLAIPQPDLCTVQATSIAAHWKSLDNLVSDKESYCY